MTVEPMSHAPVSPTPDAAPQPSARAVEATDFAPPDVDLEQARAEVGALDVFRGRGAWVWMGDAKQADSLASTLKRHRFHYFMVKAQQSTRAMNTASLDAYRRAAAAHGLAFGIWGYLTAGAD